jgi:hypothetical protein
MKVIIFTLSPTSLRVVRPRTGRKSLDIEVLPLAELSSSLLKKSGNSLVYLDVRGVDLAARTRAFATLRRSARLRFGVIDPTGSIQDVAALFYSGAVDYLGRKLGGAALTAQRVAAVQKYARGAAASPRGSRKTEEPPGAAPRSATDPWAHIVPGNEFRFAFLYVEADDAEELKKRHEPENLANAMETFRTHIEGIVAQHGGRLWMWTRFGGLALFPLGGGDCAAPLCGLRIVLSRIFYDAEVSLLPGPLSFRMALSVGSTVYRESDTGGIVSESINSIFHLGNRFTSPGQFLLTTEAAALAPAPLQGYLVPAGTYEGRKILRMLQPLPSHGEREGEPSCEP